MKLRLRGNTVRLRLLEPEVIRLGQGETIVEELPTQPVFRFTVAPADVLEMAIGFGESGLTVQVPRAWAAAWHADEAVGRSATQTTERGTIEILLEKDWACTMARPEDNRGTYPNPVHAGAK